MRPLRPLLLALVLVCAALVLVQTPAQAACRCTDVSVKRAAAQADVVLRGVMVDQADTRRRSTYTLEVERIYQGQVAETPVTVVSPRTDCGLGRLGVGRTYVVFADEGPGGLTSDRCAGTARAVPAYIAQVERVLGPGTELPEPEPEEPPQAEFTRVDDTRPPEFTRLAAPGAALVLVGMLGLFVFRRRR